MTTKETPEKAKPAWTVPFLEHLNDGETVTASAKAVEINRATAYAYRDRDPEFAAAWEAVIESSTEEMEAEAFRRAVEGIEQPVFQGGKKVGTIRKHSDTLLIFLLKARRPDVYRERISVDDEREARDRKMMESEDEAALDRRLTGLDNVTPIRKAS